MSSLNYRDVFSRFYSKVEAYDITSMAPELVNDVFNEQLHSVRSKTFVRKLFSSISMDDEIQLIKYELKRPVDDETDTDFVTDVFALGMIVSWISPKIHSTTNFAQLFASKEEKFYSQANHLTELRNVYSLANKDLRNIIADRGYTYNSYLDGEG